MSNSNKVLTIAKENNGTVTDYFSVMAPAIRSMAPLDSVVAPPNF